MRVSYLVSPSGRTGKVQKGGWLRWSYLGLSIVLESWLITYKYFVHQATQQLEHNPNPTSPLRICTCMRECEKEKKTAMHKTLKPCDGIVWYVHVLAPVLRLKYQAAAA